MNPVAEFEAVKEDLIALAHKVGLTLHALGIPTLEHALWIITDRGIVTNQFDADSLDNLIDLLEMRAKLHHGPN